MSKTSGEDSKCVASIWYRGRNRLGKSYELGPNGELQKGTTNTNAKKMRVAHFSNLEEFGVLIEECNSGAGFLTAGTPTDAATTEAAVSTRKLAKEDHLTRTNEDIALRGDVGTYLVIDYDPDASGVEVTDDRQLKQLVVDACAIADIDVSGVQMLSYPSSTSAFYRRADGKKLGNGGMHLIILVEDGGDLIRFVDALFDFLTLSGAAYGVVSKSGHLLRRSVLDKAAVRAAQPTFVGIPGYKRRGLANTREEKLFRILDGNQFHLRTREIRNPTQQEVVAIEQFWNSEQLRLRPEIEHAKRAWFRVQGKSLRRKNQDLSEAQARRVLEHRRSGNLMASDVVDLQGQQVPVSEILKDPRRFDGQIGPDPIEPDYRGGAYTAKLFINAENGRPVIHSHAHGGVDYYLWHNTRSALDYLDQLPKEQAQAVLSDVIDCTRVDDEVDLEGFLGACGRMLKVSKATLKKTHEPTLLANWRRTDSFDNTERSYQTFIQDISHIAATKLIERQRFIHTDDSQVWIYNGTHHEATPDLRVQQMLREILTEGGWYGPGNITTATNNALAALKQLTHTPQPIISQEPKKILNFRNCELHLLDDGSVEQRPHDPNSGLTSVIPIEYDPTATSPYFRRLLRRMFWDPARIRLRPRDLKEQRKYIREMLVQAKKMALHIEEVLAYLLVPSRWLPRWFFWIGEGSNGKTLLTAILELLLPEDATECDRIQTLASEFGMERLIGKTIFIDDDLETDTTIPDGLVKRISEGKRLSANRKHKSSLTFWNRAALLLLANNYPRLVDVSTGTRRRIQSVEFPRRFYLPDEIATMEDNSRRKFATHDQADTSAKQRIASELPGVVNVLIAAYQRLIKRGGFAMPEAVKRSNDKVINHGNPLPLFLEQQCELQTDLRTSTSKLAESVLDWAATQNLRWHPSRPQIRTMMAHLGWGAEKIVKIKGIEHYVGIGMLDRPRPVDCDDEFDEVPIDDDLLWQD